MLTKRKKLKSGPKGQLLQKRWLWEKLSRLRAKRPAAVDEEAEAKAQKAEIRAKREAAADTMAAAIEQYATT